jgi:hypothetical protein
MASLAHLTIWCGYALVKDGVALVFERHCDDKSRLFIALGEVLHKSPLFEQTSKPKLDTTGLKITDSKKLLSVGYPTLARIAICRRNGPES